MDMSDLNPKLPSQPLPPGGAEEPAAETGRWADVLAQLGAEIAGPLTAAIERVNALATTGQIDRQSLRALRSRPAGS